MSYIVLVRMPSGIIEPIMEGGGDEDNWVAEYDFKEAAEEMTSDQSLCQAYPYQIVKLEI